MGDRSAALLTSAQRERITEEFEHRDGGQRRRDRQRIRDRIEAGVFDFELLAEYPDEEFALAFDGVDDERMQRALVDLYLTAERLRELQGYDRSAILDTVETRADILATERPDASTLEAVDPKRPAEIRRETEQAVETRLAPDHWDRRARRALLASLGGFFPLVLVGIADIASASNLLKRLYPIVAILGIVVIGGLSIATLIRGTQTLKHDLVPLFRDSAAIRRVLRAIVHKPAETLRNTWESL